MAKAGLNRFIQRKHLIYTFVHLTGGSASIPRLRQCFAVRKDNASLNFLFANIKLLFTFVQVNK